MSFALPEKYRITAGKLASMPGEPGGLFLVPRNDRARSVRGALNCIASDGEGWEHVSVTTFEGRRTPTWAEMCRVKELFWEDTDAVVQYHPPADVYVNTHPFCLHLWRPIGVEIPVPPPELVGLMTKTVMIVE